MTSFSGDGAPGSLLQGESVAMMELLVTAKGLYSVVRGVIQMWM